MSSNRNLEFSRPLTCSLSCPLVVRYVRSFLYLPRWTVLVSEEVSGFQRTARELGSNFVIRCGMWMTPVLIFHFFETKIRSRSIPACVWHQSVWSAFNALGPPMHGLREQLGLKRLVGRHRNHSGVVSLTVDTMNWIKCEHYRSSEHTEKITCIHHDCYMMLLRVATQFVRKFWFYALIGDPLEKAWWPTFGSRPTVWEPLV